ncbi:MAG: cysteine hydrolase family protein [Deferrisomatales bacterium]
MTVRRALLVIDMLADFVARDGALRVPDAEGIVPRVAREIAAARRRGDPVVYLCDAHSPAVPEFGRLGWPPHAVRGSPGARVIPALAPQPGDSVVEKTTYSGFHGTALDAVLRGLGVERVRLTGCVTHICVLYTAADAAMRGYEVEVVTDAVAGLDPGDHQFALRQMEQVLGARLVGEEG